MTLTRKIYKLGGAFQPSSNNGTKELLRLAYSKINDLEGLHLDAIYNLTRKLKKSKVRLEKAKTDLATLKVQLESLHTAPKLDFTITNETPKPTILSASEYVNQKLESDFDNLQNEDQLTKINIELNTFMNKIQNNEPLIRIAQNLIDSNTLSDMKSINVIIKKMLQEYDYVPPPSNNVNVPTNIGMQQDHYDYKILNEFFKKKEACIQRKLEAGILEPVGPVPSSANTLNNLSPKSSPTPASPIPLKLPSETDLESLILDPKIKVILNDLNTTLGTLSETGNPNGVDMSLFIHRVKQIGTYALLKNKKIIPLGI